MRTSIFALGFLAVGLAQCGNRDLFVADERPGNAGESGATGETGGTGTGRTGGSGGGSNGGTSNAGESSGGTENTGGSNRGGSGSGAEGGEPSETGGTGGTDAGGTNAGGLGGDAMRGGAGGNGAEAGSGAAARGGTNDGGRAGAGGTNDAGRAGSSNAGRAGAGGAPPTDCEALGREYLQRLAAAQQCSPQLTVEQCTIEMPDDFFCPCKTYVNPMREADIRRLNEILEKRNGCARVCPAIACPDFKRGVCGTGTIDRPITTAPGRCAAAL